MNPNRLVVIFNTALFLHQFFFFFPSLWIHRSAFTNVFISKRRFFFLLLFLLMPHKACPKTSNFCLLTPRHSKEVPLLNSCMKWKTARKLRSKREYSSMISLTRLVPMALMGAKGLRAVPCFSHCVHITLKRKLIQSALIAFHLPNEA